MNARTTWTECHDDDAHQRAYELARGTYQRNIIDGVENLSGSTLRGKASEYGARYAASRRNLLARMTAAGIPWSERTAEHGARVLVIGTSPAPDDDAYACYLLGEGPTMRDGEPAREVDEDDACEHCVQGEWIELSDRVPDSERWFRAAAYATTFDGRAIATHETYAAACGHIVDATSEARPGTPEADDSRYSVVNAEDAD